MRAVAIQAAVATLVALAFLALGTRHALAAAVGGIAMLAGNGLAVAVALGGGIQPARAAFARLLLGTLAKWVVVLVGVTSFWLSCGCCSGCWESGWWSSRYLRLHWEPGACRRFRPWRGWWPACLPTSWP